MSRLSKIILLLLCFAGLSLFLLPQFLSSKTGLRIINHYASKAAKADVVVQDAAFSWSGPQQLKDITWKDPSVNGKIKIDSIDIFDSFLSLILQKQPSHISLSNGDIVWGLRIPVEIHSLNLNLDNTKKNLQVQAYTQFEGQQGQINVQLSNFDIANLSSAEELKKTHVNIQLKDLPVSLVNYLYLLAGGKSAPFEDIVGPSLELSVVQADQDSYNLTLHSDLLQVQGQISHRDNTLVTDKPMQVQWKDIKSSFSGSYDLASRKGEFQTQNLPLAFAYLWNPSIGKYLRGGLDIAMNLDASDAHTIKVDGSITSDNFKGTPLQVNLQVPYNLDKNSLLSFTATANNPDFKFNTKGTLAPLNTNSLIASLDGNAKLTNFPFQTYLSPDLSSLLGSQNDVDLNFHYDSGYNQMGQFKIFVNGENVSLTADLSLDEQLRLQQNGKKIELKASIPPSLLQTMLQDSSLADLHWDKPLPVSLSIDHLVIPTSTWQGGSNVHFFDNLLNRSVEGTVSIGPIEPWLPSRQKKLILGILKGSLSTTEDGKGLHLALNSSGGETSLQIEGNFGLTKHQPMNLSFQTAAVPTEVISVLTNNDKKLSDVIRGIFGDYINLNGSFTLQNDDASILANLSSQNAQVQLNGRINQGVLFLNSPLNLQANITEHMIRNFFNTTLPIMDGVVSAEGPILLSIDSQGFACPLVDFDIKKVSIRSGVIKAEVLNFSPNSELGSMLAALTPIEEDVVRVQSTPLYFKLENGVATLYRWDMLLMDSLPIACWGYVDLGSEKISMILGLTPRAVELAFNIPGLSSGHMLQIPIKGRLGNVSVDKRGAAAQLSRLVAKSTRGPEGLLLNAFLQLTGGFVKDMPAPPPTTNPLPWSTDSIKPASSPVVDTVNKGILKPVESVIQKGANTLINQIFR